MPHARRISASRTFRRGVTERSDSTTHGETVKGQDNMKLISRLAVAGVALLAVFLPLASAGAQEQPSTCSPPYCNPQVPTGGGDVLANNEEKPAALEQPAAAEAPRSAPAGELAFTGGDVVGMTVIGAGALGLGTILVRRSKAAKQSA